MASRLQGKRIVFVSAGYIGKRFIYVKAKEIGVNVVILENTDSWASHLKVEGFAEAFVGIDMSRTLNEVFEDAVIALRRLQVRFDGICTFVELSLPLTARLCQYFGLQGHPVDSVDVVRNKYKVRETLFQKGISSIRSCLIKSYSDLKSAISEVGFPAIIKPISGADSLGVRRVNNSVELEAAFCLISEQVNHFVVNSGALVRSGPGIEASRVISLDLMMEQYIEGEEVDVDIVLQNNKCLYAQVSDNGPTIEPYFSETWAVFPSTHASEVQDRLKSFAIDCVTRGLGFSSGIFHVEARHRILYEDGGTQCSLVEVNARMGGGPIRDMHLVVKGIDLVIAQLLIACDMEISCLDDLKVSPVVVCNGMSISFAYMTPNSPFTGIFKGPANFFKQFKMEDEGIVDILEYVKDGDFVFGSDTAEPKWICEIILVSKRGSEDAKRRVISLSNKILEKFSLYVESNKTITE